MSIATRTGDGGTTALMYGRRVSKYSPRVEAYGEVDELNACLGLARAQLVGVHHDLVEKIQKALVGLMGGTGSGEGRFTKVRVGRICQAEG